ncbi:MAG: 5-deoxy-glucuronate isomerase [Rhodothermales bacterium]
MQYTSQNMLVHPNGSGQEGLVTEVTPSMAGWEFINFQVRQLSAGKNWSFETGAHELAIVVLSGTIDVESSAGAWTGIGKRSNVFEGPAASLYLSINTSLTVTAQNDAEFAVAWVKAEEKFEPMLVSPDTVNAEIRGGDNVTRQINDILPPGSACQRLVICEVYTPSGGWSSYPPHKHDVHREDAAGNVIEADLEEVYYYKINRPEGYAYQRVYTDEHSPLHQAGHPIDALMMARNNDIVLVPEGYHPVVSPPGYITYYLNILAGSAQSLANVDDPQYTWVKETYKSRNKDIPVYPI